MDKAIDFYWFSGTGNTLLCTREMQHYFEQNSFDVNVIPMDKTTPGDIDTTKTLGLAFPVAFFSTYPLVWDFIEALPETDRQTKVFVLTTMGGYSGGLLGPLKKLLKRKGYLPIGAKEIVMPSNFSSHSQSTEKIDNRKSSGRHAARRFAHDLHYGLAKWIDLPVWSKLLYKVSRSKKTMGFMQKRYKLQVNHAKCTQCGICYRLCPADNIRMYEFPEFLETCQVCMRCFSYCPAKAISFTGKHMYRYRGLPATEMLNSLKKKV